MITIIFNTITITNDIITIIIIIIITITIITRRACAVSGSETPRPSA